MTNRRASFLLHIVLMEDDEFVYFAGNFAIGAADFHAVDIDASAYVVVVIVFAVPINAGGAVAFGVHVGIDGFD